MRNLDSCSPFGTWPACHFHIVIVHFTWPTIILLSIAGTDSLWQCLPSYTSSFTGCGTVPMARKMRSVMRRRVSLSNVTLSRKFLGKLSRTPRQFKPMQAIISWSMAGLRLSGNPIMYLTCSSLCPGVSLLDSSKQFLSKRPPTQIIVFMASPNAASGGYLLTKVLQEPIPLVLFYFLHGHDHPPYQSGYQQMPSQVRRGLEAL